MVVIGGKGVPFPCEKTLKVSKLEVLYIMLYFMLFDLGENSNWRKPEECKSLKIHEENGTKPEQPVQGVQYFFVLPLLGWDGIISGPVWNLIRCIIYSIKYAQFLRLIYPFKIRSEIQLGAFAAVCFSNHLHPPLPPLCYIVKIRIPHPHPHPLNIWIKNSPLNVNLSVLVFVV